jgi:hypothetical protein
MPSDLFSGDFGESEGNDREGLSRESRLVLIADFWSAIHISGHTGATDWTTLDEIEREVTEAMYGATPDVNRAESLTFKAFFLISGDI